MPQVLKDEVRHRILDAAARTFAAEGFDGATIMAIAARAGLGGATLYRYYASKEELFNAVVPPAVAKEFSRLLARRVRSLGAATARAGADAEELLRFWIDHRLAVVLLLDRAAGTPYAKFGERFVDDLVELTMEQIGAPLDPPARFVLRGIFENTRHMLASILERHARERDIRTAVEAFWSYQIAGLRAFVAAHATQ